MLIEMNRLNVLILFFFTTACSHQATKVSTSLDALRLPASGEKKLSDYSPYKYELLFTNPLCGPYKCSREVKNFDGKILTHKPVNVYCRKKTDRDPSGQQPGSPQRKIIEWINDTSTKEVFFSYPAFSNKPIQGALCSAAKRGVKIRFTMDRNEDTALALELKACGKDGSVEIRQRGHEFGLKKAHSRIFLVNPYAIDKIQIMFSSGNLSAGPVLHHENWHFVTTNPKSYFARIHTCAMEAGWDETSGRNRDAYIERIRSCRNEIGGQVAEESDIKVFFVPAEGVAVKGSTRPSATDYILNGGGEGRSGILQAKRIWLTTYHYDYPPLVEALKIKMSQVNPPELHIVADDDLFYGAQNPGGNTSVDEWRRMKELSDAGAQVRLMETNSEENQVFRNKCIFTEPASAGSPVAINCGANFNEESFVHNWENLYYIAIPSVVKSYTEQFMRFRDNMSTAPTQLPTINNVDNLLSKD